MSIEDIILRLATRGLLPCEHNLTVWQSADDGRWCAAITAAVESHDLEAFGDTLRDALEALMRATNRGADLPPNNRGEP